MACGFAFKERKWLGYDNQFGFHSWCNIANNYHYPAIPGIDSYNKHSRHYRATVDVKRKEGRWPSSHKDFPVISLISNQLLEKLVRFHPIGKVSLPLSATRGSDRS